MPKLPLDTAKFGARLQWVLMALLGSAAALPSYSEPSQSPLLNRQKLIPPANVLFTLDDSGSMNYQYLPEGSFKVSGSEQWGNVDFPEDGKVYLHPKELDENRFTFKGSNYADNRFVTSVTPLSKLADMAGAGLLQAQMRSPQVNLLYYDPLKRYFPWTTAAGASYSEPNPEYAPLDPSVLEPGQPALTTNSPNTVNLKKEPAPPTYPSLHAVNWLTPDGGADNRGLVFHPALVYLLPAGANPNAESSYQELNLNTMDYPVIWNSSDRTDCTKVNDTQWSCDKTQELQNFTNWFVFHRSRMMVAQGAIPQALQNSLGDVRLGWGTIHPKKTVNTAGEETGWTVFQPDDDYESTAHTSYTVQRGVRPLTLAHLTSFTQWLRSIRTGERRTPTLHAMESVDRYFRRTDELSPWHFDVRNDRRVNEPQSCRRSFHLLVTDGYYQSQSELDSRSDNMFRDVKVNGAAAPLLVPDIGNVDERVTAPISTTEPPPADAFPGERDTSGALKTRKAFTDGLSNTVADFAMKQWREDLQPNISNQIEPIIARRSDTETEQERLFKEVQNDPATWQHLNQLIIGFGVSGSMESGDPDLTLQRLANGEMSWPSSLNRIDDLWHAAVNSRGSYLKARDAKSMEKAFRDALDRTEAEPQSEAGVATASFLLEAGNKKFVPQYDAKTWSGDIAAYDLDTSGKTVGEPRWWASHQRPDWQSRNIFIMQEQATASGSVRNQAVPFLYDNLDATTKGMVSANLVDFIRGKNDPALNFRRREDNGDTQSIEGILPDFVNSPPLFVQGGLDLGYGSAKDMPGSAQYGTGLRPAAGSYRAMKASRPGRLFIGGNGGMLHVFDTNSGAETFAYIPKAAVPKLATIANRRYGRPDTPHQFVVDGPLIESDVFLKSSASSGGEWHNLVVGTMGAGGRAVFALEMPVSTGANQSDPIVQWEVTAPDMGYITTSPQVGRIPKAGAVAPTAASSPDSASTASSEGRWMVFVGNGIDSETNRPALLAIDIETQEVTSIPLPVPTTPEAVKHGLGGVALVKDPNTGFVTAAYAGDTIGRLWRFDIQGDGTIEIGHGGQPLFIASDSVPDGKRQPILSTPLVVPHKEGGQVIVFSTGKLLDTSDVLDTTMQSAYGVRDKISAGVSSNTTSSLEAFSQTLGRGDLVIQRIESRFSQKQSGSEERDTFFTTSRNVLNWSIHQGWAFDLKIPMTDGLTASSTAFVYPKAPYDPIAFGSSVFITAVKPGPTVPSCDPSPPEGYGFLIKALTGLAPSYLPIDTNGDGNIDEGDLNSSGLVLEGGPVRILKEPGPPGPPCTEGSEQETNGQRAIQDCGSLRIKDRAWRQLLNPPAPGSTQTQPPTPGQ